jgi:hypothetical protein
MLQKILITIILILSVLGLAHADDVTPRLLRDSTGTVIQDMSLTAGAAVYSETITLTKHGGYTSLFVIEDQAGGGGDVDIYIEYSADGDSWAKAFETNMAGTLEEEGNLATAFGNDTAPISWPVRLFPYMRYVFDPDANSEITAWHIGLIVY